MPTAVHAATACSATDNDIRVGSGAWKREVGSTEPILVELVQVLVVLLLRGVAMAIAFNVSHEETVSAVSIVASDPAELPEFAENLVILLDSAGFAVGVGISEIMRMVSLVCVWDVLILVPVAAVATVAAVGTGVDLHGGVGVDLALCHDLGLEADRGDIDCHN